jgi:hypothetical protein
MSDDAMTVEIEKGQVVVRGRSAGVEPFVLVMPPDMAARLSVLLNKAARAAGHKVCR